MSIPNMVSVLALLLSVVGLMTEVVPHAAASVPDQDWGYVTVRESAHMVSQRQDSLPVWVCERSRFVWVLPC